jgi:putative ATP-dependent endonuclease of OLD family
LRASPFMNPGSLRISRFRSFKEPKVSFVPDLTVLLGENNGGESNVIDVICFAISPLSGRGERYAEDQGVRCDVGCSDFEIEARYADLSEISIRMPDSKRG